MIRTKWKGAGCPGRGTWRFGSQRGVERGFRASVGCALAIATACLGIACSDDDPRPIGGIGDDLDADVAYDTDVDFGQYQTFAFGMDMEGSASALSEQRQEDLEWVNERMASELERIGLTSTTTDMADLLAFSLARTSDTERVEWACVPGFWGGYWYWGYGYDPCAWLDPVVVDEELTTVIAGLVDPESQDVVFVGFIRGIEGTSAARRAQITAAMEWIFDRYPEAPDDRPDMDAGGPPMGGTDAGGAGGAGGAAGAGGMGGTAGMAGAGGMAGTAGMGGAGGMGGAVDAGGVDAGLVPFPVDAGADAAIDADL